MSRLSAIKYDKVGNLIIDFKSGVADFLISHMGYNDHKSLIVVSFQGHRSS